MTTVISVRFRNGTKTYYFDPRGLSVSTGDDVVVQTAQGLEFAHCTHGNHEVEDEQVTQPLRPLVRLATANDRNTDAYNRTREKEAFDVCQKKIAAHKLEMKLVRVEYSFDGSKIIFFFTADGRVDFRELVRDLAGVFRSRIELRQIGVRDEAKMLGGLGICGRPFCCAQFMDDFIPVSIKMAKTQGLSLNPTKISGTCGRLMCCLKYEQDAYEDTLKRLPKNESFVLTPDGPGDVSDVNVLKETVSVRLDDRTNSPRCYHNCEVCVLRSGKGSRDGIDIPDTLPERYVDETAGFSASAQFSEDFSPFAPANDTPAGETGEKRRRRGRGQRSDKRAADAGAETGARPERKRRESSRSGGEDAAAPKYGDKSSSQKKRFRFVKRGEPTAEAFAAQTPTAAKTGGGREDVPPRKRTHRGGQRRRAHREKTES